MPVTLEVEARLSEVTGHLQLHSKSEVVEDPAPPQKKAERWGGGSDVTLKFRGA